ncbi:hypothetical protein ACFQ0M_36135 [Kitasatospora aburaviensis]
MAGEQEDQHLVPQLGRVELLAVLAPRPREQPEQVVGRALARGTGSRVRRGGPAPTPPRPRPGGRRARR